MTDKEREKLVQAIIEGMNNLPAVPKHSPRFPSYQDYFRYGSISPTDVEARGRYRYQESERDEQGTYYGYKVLVRVANRCGCSKCSTLRSPRFPAQWVDGQLTSDREPSENKMFGIHFTKRPDHPELAEWVRYARTDLYCVLVKCALSGTIVETEQGFRAQHAQIIGVYENGHWQSYQDYQERSRFDSRPTPEYWCETEQARWERTYIGWDRKSNPHPTPYP